MRIALIQDCFRNGGTERQSLMLASQWSSAGHEVTIVAFRSTGALYHKIGKKSLNVRTLQRWDTGFNFYAPGLVSVMHQLKPDVTLCMGRMANQKVAKLKKHEAGGRVFASVRTGKPLPRGNRKAVEEADGVIVNTQWWADSLSDAGLETSKLFLIPNGLVHCWDLSNRDKQRQLMRRRNGIDEDAVAYLSVAEFRPGKGQEHLIEAFSKLDHSNAQLWLVGEGVQRSHCQSIADRLGVAGRVKFPGYCDDPLPWYLGADVAVSASTEDAMPNFLCEAQYLGLPVVASDYRGVRDCFIDGESGYLCPIGQLQAIIDGMKSLADHGMRVGMSRLAGKHGQSRYDPARSAQLHIEAFEGS